MVCVSQAFPLDEFTITVSGEKVNGIRPTFIICLQKSHFLRNPFINYSKKDNFCHLDFR